MTFNQAKKKLDNFKEKDLDKCGVLLAKLHAKLLKSNDRKTANAIELAFMAMSLYCNKERD